MKTKRIISLALALIMALLALASCAGGNVAEKGTATLVIETGAEGADKYVVYNVDLALLEERNEGALSLLEYLAAQEGSTLYYSATWGGGYGAYLNSIGSLAPDASKEYIAVYTSVEKDFAVPSEWAPTVATVKYKDATLTYSGVGISSMTIEDGAVVLFRVEGF